MHRLFFVLISLLASPSFAVELTDLYHSTHAVSSQSEEERLKLAPTIFEQVILKVVGDRAAISQADLTAILTRSEQFIEQYQYHRINAITDDMTVPDRLEVELSFTQKEVGLALKDAGLPVWGNVRPDVLIWLAVEREGKQTILTDKIGRAHV